MLPARVTRIHQAFKEIKHMQCDTREGDYRPAARNPLKDILEYRMSNAVDAHLEQKRAEGFPRIAETAPTLVISLRNSGICY